MTIKRLSDGQLELLRSADENRPIYAEGSRVDGPTPARCFSPRTINSLVKHGFLVSDGASGFFLTAAGRRARHSGG